MSNKNFEVIKLSGLLLPESSPLKRRHVRSPKRFTDHYLERYDTQTLVYDCFYNPVKKCYTFTAPRFLNLWPLISQYLLVDGKPFTGRRRRLSWQRAEQVEIYAPINAELKIDSPDFSSIINARQSMRSMFNGLNCALAMNKNNKLGWIEDWASFHIKTHGLEGVCIIDNQSTDYSAEDILNTLSRVKGLKKAAVIQAPFPYGPVNSSKKLEISPRFLQTSMFNLVKQDMFADARAVLSVDIDELVLPLKEKSVFDAAKNSLLGAVSFREIRVYPKGTEEIAYSHSAHTLVKRDKKTGNTKWCVSGQGFMIHFGWAVHRFGGAFFPLTETKDFIYLHCHATSTSWKKNRYAHVDNLIEDEMIKKTMSTYLPDRSSFNLKEDN